MRSCGTSVFMCVFGVYSPGPGHQSAYGSSSLMSLSWIKWGSSFYSSLRVLAPVVFVMLLSVYSVSYLRAY
jgi:hypothetical protein